MSMFLREQVGDTAPAAIIQPQVLPHPQVGSDFPVNDAHIIAAAQPTPLSTLIAPAGQFIRHAPHSIQHEGLTI